MKKKYLLISFLTMMLTLIFGVSDNVVHAADDVENFYDDESVSIDYEYSFAVVGDTQQLCEKFPNQMNTMYKWIVDNKESKKIEHVFGLGDITEGDADWEWVVAGDAISQMNGVVPYSLIRGNHDTSKKMYRTFATDEYMDQFIGFYKDDSLNSSYRTLTIGETDYLLLTLDFGPDDAELNWAANIIESFPNHKVIISTHSYIARDGTLSGPGDISLPSYDVDDDKVVGKVYNNGEQIWEKLVSQYGNIVLVLSGHDSSSYVKTLQLEGVHGNVVTQMLINPQKMDEYSDNGLGMVCMLYFSKDGSQMEVEFYSTVREQYYHKGNHFLVDISKAGSHAHNYNFTTTSETHSWICDSCGAHEDNIAHKYDNNCDEDCNFCGLEREITHNYTKTGFDEHGHFFMCNECGKIDEQTYKKHLYDSECDTTCNYCNHIREVEHNYTVSNSDSNSHWLECSVCHEMDFYSRHAHVYDNNCDKDCNECGYVRSTVHDYSTVKKEGDKYYIECKICGEKVETKAPEVIIEEEGCSGSIGASIIGISMLLVAVMFLKIKSVRQN